ncbi:MAG: hypothetical protein EP338_13470 [Bacteroidetes bacterium]|nr:MAG: hypothetical protein EP338_13470 [Bacteroidota bacterium]
MKHWGVFLIFFLIFQTGLLGQEKKVIDSINQLDYIYVSNNLAEAKELFQKNIESARKIGYSIGEADALHLLAAVYCLQANYDEGVKTFIEAANIYEREKEYQKLATAYADIGFRIRYIDVNKGVDYFRKAVTLYKKHRLTGNLHAVYNNYGETIRSINSDSALYYFKKSLAVTRKDDSIAIPFCLNNLAEEYARRKQFKLAFKYMNESDAIRFKFDDPVGKADNWAYRGDIFFEIPQIDSSIYYYEKSLRLARECEYDFLLRYDTKRLALLYQEKGDYQNALKYFKMNKQLEDSVLNSNVQEQLAALQVEFDTEHTKLELAEQKSKLEARQKWITVAVGALIVLIITSFFLFRYQRSKRENELKELELKKQLETARLEKEFANEKIRISRELHDNIGSHLTFLISSLDNLGYLPDSEKKLEKIADLSHFGRQTMKDLRDTIWAMNHEEGSVEQLMVRITELRSVLPENLYVDIDNEVEEELVLNGLQLLNIFRIVQEFIQNTIKYAGASEIKLSFRSIGDSLELRLSDNGKGFDLKEISFGNGIHNMKKRCEDIQGHFEIESGPSGTLVVCRLPVQMNLESLQ